MKKGWEVRTIGELSEILDNRRRPITKKDRISGDIPYYGASGVLSYVDDYIFNEDLVLLGEDGAKWYSGAKSAFRISGKTWVNNHAHVLKPNIEKLIYDWLIYYLNFSNLEVYTSGLTVPKLNQKNMRGIQIPLPPLDEQKAIVTKLDQAFKAIDQAKANIEQNLANAEDLFQSKLNQIFSQKGEGWEEKKLGEVALIFGRGKSKHRPRNWEGLFNGSYPFVQTGDVRNAEKYIKEYKKSYNEVGLKQSKLWKKDTICITIAANIAETAILSFDACFPDSIIGLKVDPLKANMDYTYFLLQYFKSELQKLGKGSAQDNINLGTFEKQFFPFPKVISEQKNIASKLDLLQKETKKLKSKYEQKLESLEELKQSILEKAFKGELV